MIAGLNGVRRGFLHVSSKCPGKFGGRRLRSSLGFLEALTGHLYFACYFRASCNNASRTALESGYDRKGNKGGGELPTRNRAKVLRSLHDVPWAEQMHRCAG
jgi:hypothetical protein